MLAGGGHNGRVIRRTTLAVLACCTTLALAGCGGGSGTSSPSAGSSGSGSSGGASATTKVDGIALTAQGSALKVGDKAVLSWQPTQKTTGVIRVAVTGLEKLPISAFSSWRLTPATQRSTPYFVKATVQNLGRTNLSGVTVPLYLLDQHNTLLQASTFQAQYPPCPSKPLPSGFTRHKSTAVCLVYFVPDHGSMVAVSFRPSEAFNAITWKGPVTTPPKSHHHKKKKH